MTTGRIEDRLRAALRMDAMNGEHFERNICALQMAEAASEIDTLREQVAGYRQTLEAVSSMSAKDGDDLEQLAALMAATAKTGLSVY